ncbi:hypothetical protein WJ40_20030 [Burkholderia cepacia]|nr:hypothetical protein WJ40_20030 [Burkholderia cepacia]
MSYRYRHGLLLASGWPSNQTALPSPLIIICRGPSLPCQISSACNAPLAARSRHTYSFQPRLSATWALNSRLPSGRPRMSCGYSNVRCDGSVTNLSQRMIDGLITGALGSGATGLMAGGGIDGAEGNCHAAGDVAISSLAGSADNASVNAVNTSAGTTEMPVLLDCVRLPLNTSRSWSVNAFHRL